MSNSLDAVLAQYEKNKQSGGSTKPQMTSEEKMNLVNHPVKEVR